MHFGLSEEQQQIKNSVKEFLSAECPMAEVRRLMETENAIDDKLWRKFAEQGWTGIIFPEAYDGFGLGLFEMAVALEEMGRSLVPGPFISTVLLAGTLIERAGSEEQKKKYLGAICRGEAKATLALLERSATWDVEAVTMAVTMAVTTLATTEGLTGEKLFVPDAGAADFIIVAVRDGLYIVPATAPGVTRTLTPSVDLTRRLYTVTFDNVQGELLASGPGAKEALQAALDVACLGTTAEMVGGMQRLLEITVEYAKTRKQFGKPIGTFQAVQHQCADMLFYVEGARSALYYAAWSATPDAISVAKAYAGEAYRICGNSSIQVQGGMGFTWENDAHLFYRRARASEIAFGDATFHRERLASILI